MKILVITEGYPPDLDPEALSMGKLVNGCISAGHHVTVVTTEHGPEDRSRTDTSDCWERVLGCAIRVPRPPGKMSRITAGIPARIWGRLPGVGSWTYAAYRQARILVGREDFDCVISGYVPLRTVLVGHALKDKFGIPWFVMFNDPSPWCLFPEPYGPGKPVTMWDRYVVHRMRKVLSHANAIIAPSAKLAAYVNEVFADAFGERRIIVPHIGWSRPSSGQAKPGIVRILHFGLKMHGRESELLVATLSSALEEARLLGIDARVTFIGYVSGDRSLPEKMKSLGPSIEWASPIAYEESLLQMNSAAALLLVEAVMQEGIFLPSKIADYAASGRPVLMFSPRNGTVADLVGGLEHPGFLTQDPDVASDRLIKFLKQAAAGSNLDQYRFPHPLTFAPERVVDSLTSGIEKYKVAQA